MPITANDIQNIINAKGYQNIYSNPKVSCNNNCYSVNIQTNGMCGKRVPKTSFVHIKNYGLNGSVLWFDFGTSFSPSLNTWMCEIADLLFYYQL